MLKNILMLALVPVILAFQNTSALAQNTDQMILSAVDSSLAASLTVTTTADDPNDGVCDAHCTLRDAISVANATTGTDTITFDIAGAGPHIIQLGSALPNLADSVDILNTSGESVTVRRNTVASFFLIFIVSSGQTVNISGLTITNGSTSSGGGIQNRGTLTLTDCTVSDNRGDLEGGGINNNGTLTITRSTISGNSTIGSGRGGGINNDGTLTITNSTISGNSAGFGGGINMDGGGTVTLRSTIVAGNSAGIGPDIRSNVQSQGYNLVGNTTAAIITPTTGDQFGTGAAPIDPKLGPLADNGGPTKTHRLLSTSPAIDKGDDFSASPTTDQRGALRPFNDPSIANAGDGSDIGAYELQGTAAQSAPSLVVNTPDDHDDGANGCTAGDCTLREAITAANATTGTDTITFDIDGAGPHIIQLGSELPELTDSVNILNNSGEPVTVRRNTGGGYGIFYIYPGKTVNISGITITNGEGGAGGAIYSEGTLTLTDCTVSDSSSAFGGGIYNIGTLTITRSTISGNSTLSGDGGGIFNSGTLTLTNSTVSGNTARDRLGGGIYNTGSTLTLTNSTVSGNSAGFGGGISGPGVILRSTIVAGNSATNDAPDIHGTVQSEGYNLIQNTSGTTINETANTGTNITGVDPQLGPLADNGGPTETHRLLSTSPAIDKGDDFSASPTTDQRGFPRPIDHSAFANAGDGSDIGSFELEATDFGDAPDPTYPTLLASNGARHGIVTGFSLGAWIDGEPDGSPSANASGDGADEDGVTIPSSLRICKSTNLTVNLTNTAGIATPRLDAWIDFNRDGDFADAGEKIANNFALSSGANQLPVTVPCDVVSGNSLARFRLSSTGGLSFNGAAADGEVEDYSVSFVRQEANLSVTKTDSPDPVSAGGNITYTITVNNNGPDTASNAVLTDVIPANTTFVSLSFPAGFNCTTPAVGATGTVTCTAANFAAGQATFTLVVKVNPSATGSISNTANVSSDADDPDTDNNSATSTTTITSEAALALSLVVSPDPVSPGGTSTYQMTLTNSGNVTAQNVVLYQSDYFHQRGGTRLQIQSITAPAGFTCQMGGGLLDPPLTEVSCRGTLGAGQTVQFTVIKRQRTPLPRGLVIFHEAEVMTSTFEANKANNKATDTTQVN